MDDRVEDPAAREPQHVDGDDDDEMVRICDELVHDFDGTCVWIANELSSAADPQPFLEVLHELLRRGDEWLPADVMDRLESEFLSHVVQLLLGRAFHPDAVEPVNDFLQAVLDRVVQRLLQCDPCLLPSLVRVFDDSRHFYLCHSGDVESQDEKVERQLGLVRSSRVVSAERLDHVSSLFLRNVAYWGELGGFTVLLQCLEASQQVDEEQQVTDAPSETNVSSAFSFDAVQCIFRALFSVKEHLSPSFLLRYFPALVHSTQRFVRLLSTEEFLAVPRDSMLEVVQVLELFALGLSDAVEQSRSEDESDAERSRADASAPSIDSEQGESLVQLTRLEILRRYFLSNALEKRIYGLTEIISTIASSASSTGDRAQTPAATLLQWVEDHEVIASLFGESKHPELLKRAPALFRLAAEHGRLSAAWVGPLWRCVVGRRRAADSVTDPDGLRSTAVSLLLDTVEAIQRPADLQHVFSLATTDIHAIDSSVLAVLRCLGLAAPQRELKLREAVLRHVWLVLPALGKSRETVDAALGAIEDLLRAEAQAEPDSCLLQEFVRLCVDNLTTRCNSLVSVRVAEKCCTIAIEGGVASCIDQRLVERLASVLVHDLGSFRRADETDAAEEQDLNATRERLLALRAAWMLRVPAKSVSFEETSSIWELLVDGDAADGGRSLFFRWLELCCSSPVPGSRPTEYLLSDAVVQLLITTKFDALPPTELTLSALCCFHQLFRCLNVSLGGLDAGPSEQSQGTPPADLRTGKPLVGLEQLWRIAISATDVTVAEEAIVLLARYHLDVAQGLRESAFATATRLDFVRTSMAHISTAMQQEQSVGSALVNRALDCLRYFLEASAETSSAAKPDGEQQSDDPAGLAPTTTKTPVRATQLEWAELDDLRHLEILPSPMKDAEPSAMGGPRRPSWTFRQQHELLQAIEDRDDEESADRSDESLPTTTGLPSESRLTLEMPAQEALRPTQLTRSPTVRSRPSLVWPSGKEAPAGPVVPAVQVDDALKDLESSKESTLSQHSEYYDLLFSLLDWGQEQSARAWELLCRMPMSTQHLQRVARLRPAPPQLQQSPQDVQWGDLLDTSSVYRFQYGLRIVEALLLPLDDANVNADAEAREAPRRQWRERFVRLGGLQYLADTLARILEGDWLAIRGGDSHPERVVAATLKTSLRVVTYYVELFRGAKRAPPTTRQLSASSCPFDKRLSQLSLPQFFRDGLSLELLTRIGLYAAANGPVSEVLCEAQVEGTRLVLALALVDPPRVHRVLCASGDKWIRATIGEGAVPQHVREAVRSALVDIAKMLVAERRGLELLEHVFRSVINAMLGSSSAGQAPTWTQELVDVAVALASIVAQIDGTSRVSGWLCSKPVALRLVEWLEERPANAAPGVEISACLRLMLALSEAFPQFRTTLADLDWPSDGDARAPAVAGRLAVSLAALLWQLRSDGWLKTIKAQHDPTTRQLAEQLLSSVVLSSTGNRQSIAFILQELRRWTQSVNAELERIGRPWSFSPTEELKAETPFAGLQNPGCVCYMNSLLQQLFMIPSFRCGLLSTDCTAASLSPWADEVKELQRLFVSLTESQRSVLDPTAFALSHRDLDGNPTDLRVQMDADEFFCLLLDRMETFLNRDETTAAKEAAGGFLSDCFGGVLVNQIITEHGHISEREEKFFALSLDISKTSQLADSLSLFVQGETLDGENAYYCEKMQRKVSATKRVCVKTLPRTLVCHLKRFEFDFDTMEKVKLNDYLAFPEEIDMAPFTRDALTTGASCSEAMYDLVGVVIHSGTADMGHYYSFIRDRGRDKQWLEFNDQTVRPLDPATLGDECFGGEEIVQKWDANVRAVTSVVQMKRRSAYMLLYERRAQGDAADASFDPYAVNWQADVPTSVADLASEVARENDVLLRLVDAFRPSVDDLLLCIASELLKGAPDVEPGGSAAATEPLDLDLDSAGLPAQAAAVASEHVLGALVLRRSPSSVKSEEDKEAAILRQVASWVDAQLSTRDAIAFSSWLLQRVISRPSGSQALLADGSAHPLRRRSLLFDALFVRDRASVDFSDALTSLLVACLRAVTATPHAETKDIARSFLRAAVETFYDREDLELVDTRTGAISVVLPTAIVAGISALGSLLRECVAETCSPLREMLVTDVRFFDAFLHTMQSDMRVLTSAPALTYPASSISASGDAWVRTRSCSLADERAVLKSLSGLIDRSRSEWMDATLLSGHTALRNIVALQFADAFAPALVEITRSSGDVQRNALLSLLVAVLEDVKTSHLDQVLILLDALLDAEVADASFPCVHRHLLSPTTGALEAAAYYRDHALYHEYAFLLVEFAIRRALRSDRVRTFFQSDSDVMQQVAWIKDWLAAYVDPQATSGQADKTEPDPSDEGTALIAAAETAFGFSLAVVKSAEPVQLAHAEEESNQDSSPTAVASITAEKAVKSSGPECDASSANETDDATTPAPPPAPAPSTLQLSWAA
ncbi:hypothetical protein ATCC90586_000242 [Pythium insidiosum]|nr:hypothetical protein ATCC90586_000242 [Pythium insidiosum]